MLKRHPESFIATPHHPAGSERPTLIKGYRKRLWDQKRVQNIQAGALVGQVQYRAIDHWTMLADDNFSVSHNGGPLNISFFVHATAPTS